MIILAVAAHLAAYQFTLKTSPPSKFNPSQKESIPEPFQFKPSQESKEWNEGAITAESQNFARTVCLHFYLSGRLLFLWCLLLVDGIACEYDDTHSTLLLLVCLYSC